MFLPPGLIIRAGTPGDAPFIQRVHEESIRGLGPRCYSRAQVESWASGLTLGGYVRAMNQGGERFLLAEPETGGGRLASFCSFAGDRIIGLYTHPHWAGRGVAGALLARAEAAITGDGHELIGITATLVGRAFYEKHGYRVLQPRDSRTRGGLVVAVLEMEKRFPRAPSFPSPPFRGRGE
jgi:GNAT superfamily N-acetyltransferase